MKPSCLTLFAGAGGADVGLREAGWDHIACVEWDRAACDTLRAAGFPAVQGDVRDLSLYADLPAVDLLWASPPCQAWSSAGKRLGAFDERNGWPWTLDVIDYLQAAGRGPAWFIAENVPGLLHHRGDCDRRGEPESCPGCYFERVVLPAVRARFAFVRWTVLDAADYGVPQRRHRVFIVAGPAVAPWPVTTHADPAELRQEGLFGDGRRPWVTVREALGLRGRFDPDRGAGCAARRGERPSVPTSEPAPTLASECRGGFRYTFAGIDPKHPPCIPDAPSPTLRSGGSGHDAPGLYLHVRRSGHADGTTEASVDAPAPTIQGPSERGAWDRLSLAASEPWRLDEPSPAVLSTEDKGARHQGNATAGRTCARASDALWRATGRRRLTVAEAAALQSFPPDYPWRGTKTAQYRQVGNAVPPPVARVLGLAVLEAHQRARSAA